MTTDLVQLMAYVNGKYTFTPEHYPVLQGASAEEVQAFAISHSAHHMSKSLGKISAESEAHDHGGKLDFDALQIATAKMFVNTLRLASELGLNATQLAQMVPEVMKSK